MKYKRTTLHKRIVAFAINAGCVFAVFGAIDLLGSESILLYSAGAALSIIATAFIGHSPGKLYLGLRVTSLGSTPLVFWKRIIRCTPWVIITTTWLAPSWYYKGEVVTENISYSQSLSVVGLCSIVLVVLNYFSILSGQMNLSYVDLLIGADVQEMDYA